jgi:plasmid stability protein
MAMQVTIDQLEPEVVAALRRRAQAAGRSLEQELREIVRDAARVTTAPAPESGMRDDESWVDYLRRRRKEIWGDQTVSDTTALIRKMRDERRAG